MAIGILSMIVLFLVSMLPSSIGSLRRAEAVQGATLYATGMLETARQSPSVAPIDTTITVNDTRMHVVQSVIPAGPGLVDVKVTINYRPDATSIVMTTRLGTSP